MTETEAQLTRILYLLILAELGQSGKPQTEMLLMLKQELDDKFFDERVLNG